MTPRTHDDLTRTVNGLLARATDTRCPAGERAAAQAAISRLAERFGASTVDAIVAGLQAETDANDEIRYKHDWEKQLAIRAGHHLGLTMREFRNATKKVLAFGPPGLLATWQGLVTAHRARLREVVRGTVDGYLVGAMPIELTAEEVARAVARHTSEEERLAQRAGLQIGNAARALGKRVITG